MYMWKKSLSSFFKDPSVAFYAISIICLLMEWTSFKSSLGIEYSNIIGSMLKAFGDVVLILLPYWLLPPRWRWSAVIPVWFYAIWCVCNLAYFRFWGDLIPLAAVTMGGNVDANLFSYGLSLLRWSDLLFLITPLAASLALYRIHPYKVKAYSLRAKIWLFCLSLIVGFAGQYSYFKTAFAWNNAMSPQSLSVGLKSHFFCGYTSQKGLYTYNGLVYYAVRCSIDIIDLLNVSIQLDNSQISEISDFLQHYQRLPSATPDSLDSLNVVYIIVESLNADMIHRKIADHKIMPVLDSLANAEGTVFFSNVVSQIKASSSSDGHLLLMTGLLPPDKIAYSIFYGSNNRFPSIADVLPRHEKYLILADDGVCWNEGNTLKNFGLGDPITLHDRVSYDPDRNGRDGAMFLQASDMVRNINQPFFMTLMTISMHIPFKEQGWPLPDFIADAKGLNEREKDYANVCLHTDMYIGIFIKYLPDNTIIFIASDHSQSVASGNDSSPAAAFLAVNSGRSAHISRPVGQVNIFPATLDILGRSSGYGGIAPSAFNPAVDGSRDAYGNIYGNPTKESLDSLNDAFRISDLIIRGNYFNSSHYPRP